MAVLAHHVGKEVCELLGLDPKTTYRVEFVFKAGDLVRINAAAHATREQVDGLFDVVRRFKLVEVGDDGDGEKVPPPAHFVAERDLAPEEGEL